MGIRYGLFVHLQPVGGFVRVARVNSGRTRRDLPDRRGAGSWPGHGGGQGTLEGMEKSSDSGAKAFAILVGIMVAIVVVIGAIAMILSPH